MKRSVQIAVGALLVLRLVNIAPPRVQISAHAKYCVDWHQLVGVKVTKAKKPSLWLPPAYDQVDCLFHLRGC